MRRVMVALALAFCLMAAIGAGSLDKQIGYGGSAGLQHVGGVSYDTVTVLVATSNMLDQNTDEAWDAADSVHDEWPQTEPDVVLRDVDGSYFKYLIAANQVNQTDSGSPPWQPTYNPVIFGDSTVANLDVDDHDPILNLIWASMESLPTGARLINYELCVVTSSAGALGGGGFVTAITNTCASDLAWLDAPMMTIYGANSMRYADAGWDSIDESLGTPVDPDFTERSYDFLGVDSNHYTGGPLLAESELTFNTTYGVQYALDNSVYSGNWMWGHRPSSEGFGQVRYRFMRPGLTAEGDSLTKQPFVKYTYTTNLNYRGPWPGGKRFAIVCTVDDNHLDNIETQNYAQCFRNRGVKYTLFCSGWHVDGYRHPMGGFMTGAEILENSDAYEIGSHTYTHYSEAGLDFFTEAGWRDTSFAYFQEPVPGWEDTLHIELNSGWMADAIGVDSTQVKAIAWPSCQDSDAIIAHLIEHYPNYIVGRACTDGSHPLNKFADVDSIFSIGLNTGHWSDNGTHATHSLLENNLTYGQVEAKLDSMLNRTQYNEPLVLLWHAGPGTSYNGGYGEADSTQVGFLLDAAIARGDVAIITASEAAAAIRALHTDDGGGITWEWAW